MLLRRCAVLFLVVFLCAGEDATTSHRQGLYIVRKDHEELYKAEPQGPVIYDAYFGKPLSDRRSNFLNNIASDSIASNFINGSTVSNVANASLLCTVRVEPCRKDEGRRVDGTCINPKYPSRGATLTPFLRLLPPMFGPGSSLRPGRDGFELPSTRVLRTTLLADGYITSHDFSHLTSHVIVGVVGDSVDLFYLLRYVAVSDCCPNNQIPNEVNPTCIPIRVPADDPYLRRTDIRCLNLTRVETYQDYGCIPRTLPAERYNRVTPVLDLSLIYGLTEERSREIRSFQGGLLTFRMEGDREVPEGQSPWCLNNKPPLETVCYNFGDNYHTNLLPGGVLPALFQFREHNRLARKLRTINDCWDDEKLFQTARKILIAQWQYIIYYEFFAVFMGRKNALADGIIYDTLEYVNDFDPEYKPGVYREFTLGYRWFHTFLSGFNDLYRRYKYAGSRRQVDDILRSGIFPLNNTEADMTQGALIQPEDELDDVIDPDIAERLYGDFQRAADLPAIDMMRGRDAGLPPYNHYRKLCGMKVADKFEDFEDAIDKDKVEALRRLYDDVEDVELMVAIYAERLLPGAYVGPTLYCLLAHQLVQWRKSDRFFFEHGEFPAAFTKEQLREIKKNTSIARLVCNNSDNVNMIQRQAFRRKSTWNPLVPCEKIPQINLNAWKDDTCRHSPTKK